MAAVRVTSTSFRCSTTFWIIRSPELIQRIGWFLDSVAKLGDPLIGKNGWSRGFSLPTKNHQEGRKDSSGRFHFFTPSDSRCNSKGIHQGFQKIKRSGIRILESCPNSRFFATILKIHRFPCTVLEEYKSTVPDKIALNWPFTNLPFGIGKLSILTETTCIQVADRQDAEARGTRDDQRSSLCKHLLKCLSQVGTTWRKSHPEGLLSRG